MIVPAICIVVHRARDLRSGSTSLPVGDAECATFLPLSGKGGLAKVTGHVGADVADCLTFPAR